MDDKSGVFCEKCGAKLIDGVCPQCVNESKAVRKQKDDKFRSFFLAPNEKMVTVLGNSYLQTFLNNGDIRKGFAIVSNKRAYFRGTSYNVTEDKKGKRHLIRTHQSRVVDLRDITGVGFDSYSDEKWIILSFLPVLFLMFFGLLSTVGRSSKNSLTFILFICLLGVVYCWYRYFKSQRTCVIIQHAGGAIAFDKNWYTDDEIEQFQQLILIAKDKVLTENDNKSIKTTVETTLTSMMDSTTTMKNVSIADEIAKLNDLMTQGIISQEEFDKAKKELLH